MEEPIYSSKPTAKSLWREYRLFPDRIELDSIPWGMIHVPLDDVKSVQVRPPVVIFDLFRGDHAMDHPLRVAKLDFADLAEHVSLEKTGFWKQFRFTPDDPQAFKAAVDRALSARRSGQER